MGNSSPVAKKSLGQHWLHDSEALQAMCEAAKVQSTDTILEIGPGLGTLTRLLTTRAGKVVAVELDQRLAQELPGRVPATNLEVRNEDILAFDLGTLPPDFKVVANIPYYLTSNLIRVLSEAPNRPSKAVILVQKEVAQRAAAQPGAMSLLSVTAQFYWHVSLGREVPAELFTPPPKISSQILLLERPSAPLFADIAPKPFFWLVKAGFSQRRKTLLNSLAAGLRIEKNLVIQACERVAISPTRRPQTLSLEEWRKLYIHLDPYMN